MTERKTYLLTEKLTSVRRFAVGHATSPEEAEERHWAGHSLLIEQGHEGSQEITRIEATEKDLLDFPALPGNPAAAGEHGAVVRLPHKPCILLAGNAIDGHAVYGPFAGPDQANSFGEAWFDQWTVVQLKSPNDENDETDWSGLGLPPDPIELADDQFQCERCGAVHDIEDSVKVGGKKGAMLCPTCAQQGESTA